MKHFVYETTNLINGRKYIGKHSTNNMEDGYLGSGTGISLDIQKYGKKHFKIKILKKFKTEDEAYHYESKKLKKIMESKREYYNRISGGTGKKVKVTKEKKEKPKNILKSLQGIFKKS